MLRTWLIAALVAGCIGCDDGDAWPSHDGAFVDAAPAPDVAPVPDAEPLPDAEPPRTLARLRDRLFASYADGNPCPAWNSLDASRRAVFATLTHRLFIADTPDGLAMLDHLTALHLVLGGGASGTACGGAENNRLFVSMDEYLWGLMVDTWNDERVIGDGAGALWRPTQDLAGPHDPFDASNETETGLDCIVLIETEDSRPPTAQAHFFQADSAAPVERGDGIQLPADPYMLELDHDYDCFHQSNPLCPGLDFEQRYRSHYGEFECDWVPSACSPDGTGCYRGVL